MSELSDLMARRGTFLVTQEMLARLFDLPPDVYVKRVFVKDDPNVVALECVSERFDRVDPRQESPIIQGEVIWHSPDGDPSNSRPYVRAYIEPSEDPGV